jgi:hypothetical protein
VHHLDITIWEEISISHLWHRWKAILSQIFLHSYFIKGTWCGSQPKDVFRNALKMSVNVVCVSCSRYCKLLTQLLLSCLFSLACVYDVLCYIVMTHFLRGLYSLVLLTSALVGDFLWSKECGRSDRCHFWAISLKSNHKEDGSAIFPFPPQWGKPWLERDCSFIWGPNIRKAFSTQAQPNDAISCEQEINPCGLWPL